MKLNTDTVYETYTRLQDQYGVPDPDRYCYWPERLIQDAKKVRDNWFDWLNGETKDNTHTLHESLVRLIQQAFAVPCCDNAELGLVRDYWQLRQYQVWLNFVAEGSVSNNVFIPTYAIGPDVMRLCGRAIEHLEHDEGERAIEQAVTIAVLALAMLAVVEATSGHATHTGHTV